MDESINGDTGAWALSRLGNAIDVYVDRTINKPQVVYDSSQAFGVDEQGNLYQLGQSNGQLKKPALVGGISNTVLLMLVIGGVLLMKG